LSQDNTSPINLRPKNRGRRSWSLVILAVLAVLFCVIELSGSLPRSTTAVENLDLSLRDLALRLRGVQEPETPIVIVAIDDASFNYTGYQWPWPREYLAEIVDVLQHSGARVIGLDIFLFEESPDPAGDDALALALQDSQHAVSVMHISRAANGETLNLPVPAYETAIERVGITGIISDDDAIVRGVQGYDYSAYNETIYLNWAFEAASLYMDAPPPELLNPEAILFNGQVIPLFDQRMLIDFAGPPQTYAPYYSAHQVALGDYPPDAFRDKLVLIGATTITLHDVYPTPFSARESMPGVEIVANAIDTILTGSFYRLPSPAANLALILLAAGLCIFIIRRRQPIAALAIMAGSMSVYAILWYLAFQRWNLIFTFSAVQLMLFLGSVIPTIEQVVAQELEKRRVRSLFSRFISPEMVDQLLETQDIRSLNKRAELTILFSDIRSFTSISERLTPEEVVALLNPYLEVMTEIIHKYGGTVDKYEGDAILAFFGEPIPYEDHALRAVRAAWEMRAALVKLRNDWQLDGRFGDTFEIGIGINTGEVFIGMLGSAQRINYTVIGDDVNLAARLQDKTKDLDWPILISASTQALIDYHFFTESTGPHPIKGKSEPVEIYRLKGPR
jgi:adenylate cyclase